MKERERKKKLTAIERGEKLLKETRREKNY